MRCRIVCSLSSARPSSSARASRSSLTRTSGRWGGAEAGDPSLFGGLFRDRSATVSAMTDETSQPSGSPERNETPAERSDRNWAELLQELRVAQTGVQLLTAF